MNVEERAVVFACGDQRLVSIVAIPENSLDRGVLIVVGGPQYRVGSHRQFLLLSRQLADAGVPVLRFDYRGMGDSSGNGQTFELVEDDIRAAVDAFFREAPQIKSVVIWGLCDAASAALMYAPLDSRVVGLVLANPWVRTPDGLAKTMMKHYYGTRLLQWEFWRKLVTGEVNVLSALGGVLRNIFARCARKKENLDATPPFPERMALGLKRFSGHVVFFLSGQDLTAQEFLEMIQRSPRWQDALKRPHIEWRRLDDATHTFSRREWRDRVGHWTIEWIRSW
ncbi:MAG TPA: hydrolase 1, exosortase A system-associated [Burkholderiales bacterium]|nr:hydrolase 1, exosortase A system-associated [Burkholderiales bacterium]